MEVNVARLETTYGQTLCLTEAHPVKCIVPKAPEYCVTRCLRFQVLPPFRSASLRDIQDVCGRLRSGIRSRTCGWVAAEDLPSMEAAAVSAAPWSSFAYTLSTPRSPCASGQR